MTPREPLANVLDYYFAATPRFLYKGRVGVAWAFPDRAAAVVQFHGSRYYPKGTPLPINWGPPTDAGQPIYKPTTVVGGFEYHWWTGTGGYGLMYERPEPRKLRAWSNGRLFGGSFNTDWWAGAYFFQELPTDGSPVDIGVENGAHKWVNPSGGTALLHYADPPAEHPPWTDRTITVSYEGVSPLDALGDTVLRGVTGYPPGAIVHDASLVEMDGTYENSYWTEVIQVPNPVDPAAHYTIRGPRLRTAPFLGRTDGSWEFRADWDYGELAEAIRTSSQLAPTESHPHGLTLAEAEDIAAGRDVGQNSPDVETGNPSSLHNMTHLPWDAWVYFIYPNHAGMPMFLQ